MDDVTVGKPPRGLAVLAVVGPSLIWAAEYIGSGEVILATRTGAIFGSAVLWAIVIGIFLKYWIAMSGARYTVCTGEGMIDMFDRMPGPRHWAVWIIMVAQLIGATVAIGALATASTIFVCSLLPIGKLAAGLIVVIFAVSVAWTGAFDVLKVVMSFFVAIIVLGIAFVASRVMPDFSELVTSMSLRVPPVPQWAIDGGGASGNPWQEILPLIGWGAGGFASQVWYTYWVLGAGYGAAAGRGYGRPADLEALKNMSSGSAEKIRGWCKVLYTDATLGLVIGIFVTGAFYLAGSGVLNPRQLAPQGNEVAFTLSNIFSTEWGSIGGFLFRLSGAAALISTVTGQLAGWPRLLADTLRICFPGFATKYPWKIQFRGLLVFFFCTNMIIVLGLGMEPVRLIKFSALLDGILLTAFQALCVGVALFFVMPRMLSKDAAGVLKPSPVFAVGLILAFVVFAYFCIFQMPASLVSLLPGR
jgi:Mn2+/Fe2+ NRAMP family transporter